ncbi:MAG: tetratricopeptide repeat protein, partial [Gammaproteobacteria bacterium]
AATGAADHDGTLQAEGAESQAGSSDQPPVEAQPVSGETTDLAHQLERARSLYWKQQSEAAESAYQALAREHADNAELWGEIGNFYYSLGRNEQAAEAYSRAIELLVRDDKQERARQLLEALSRLNPQKARELEMKMR